MKVVATVLGVARSNLAKQLTKPITCNSQGRPTPPDTKLVTAIRSVMATMPTYGYRRVHAILKRRAVAAGLAPSNHKRVYRVMKVNNLLLARHAKGDNHKHDGYIATEESNLRWCSNGFELNGDNGENVRVRLRTLLL